MLDHLTMSVSLSILAIIIVYDVWTLSARNLYAMAMRFPIVPFALGIVAGHLFWPNRAGQ